MDNQDIYDNSEDDLDNMSFEGIQDEYIDNESSIESDEYGEEDETDKVYYKEFGDVISFDATFRTNKYGMVFVPFTAIDNHKCSITVGAGLLSNETIESYKWLLEAFLRAHGKQPTVVLTDQDAAIKQAGQAILPDSKHRWCMWHIMKKLQAKVTQDFLQNTNFRKRFNKLVWNVYLDPEVFEREWNLLINEFNLDEKRWFKDMYEHRTSWIPAYFKDIPMHGLMKTTSRSESTNSFFNKFAHHGNFLVYFMINYDTALEKQRKNQRDRENSTKKANQKMTMSSGLEKHAAEVYTNKMFLQVQKEISKGTWNCSIETMQMVDGLETVIINHLNKSKDIKTSCKVEINLSTLDVQCSCEYFMRMGILCRHVFAVLKNNRIDKIPEKYIKRRWRKNVIASNLLLKKYGCFGAEDETSKLLTEAYQNIEYCMDNAKFNKEKLSEFVEMTRQMRKKFDDESSTEHANKQTDEEEVMQLLGVRVPEKIEIRVPQSIRNKGSGTKKRLASASEKASSSSKSKTRKCSGCDKYINHNWRTCPERIARDEALKNKEK
ncbi:hypothetical protein L1887_38466 [Cichorium endivia]|nr:hypothetical protein L1887_38466 [Cichorium endivia]